MTKRQGEPRVPALRVGEDARACARRQGWSRPWVLAANADGSRFARARGFVERERYVLDGESDEWVGLRLAPHPS
ncbi:hypothetical protein ACIQ8D_14525 [Streptomyces sp. NPDC096094]|uniref:hypothetical protein n=1 Tax=Streptomyces sp. NPDC096094 TaxID=3366073 RepID=UPI0038261053